MPHSRPRYLQPGLEKALKWSPTLSLLGMRQTGKTTLLRKLGSRYLTLDDDQTAARFDSGDWSLLESGDHPLALDECQKSKGLFDRIKLLVDRTPKPGQFILTGSVRFLSKKQIRESLTGRTALFELLPMTLAESHSLPASRFISTMVDLKPSGVERFLDSLNRTPPRFTRKQCLGFLEIGGLPGIAFKRDAGIRKDLWSAQLETLLSRDIRQLYPTELPYQKLKTLFVEIAGQQSLAVNHSQLARRIGVSAPTVKQLLAAFEGLFLIRRVEKTYYCEDQGLASSVLGAEGRPPLLDYRRLAFQELFSQLNYQFRSVHTLTHYSTRGGIDIPFLIKIQGADSPLAIVVDDSDGASDKSLKSLTWYKRRHPKVNHLVVLHQGSRAYRASSGALCLPIERIF